MVVARGVTKSFGSFRALRGVDLEVDYGDVACILGPSGSGKSTLLRCINRLEHHDGGTIRVDGKLVGFDERNGKLYEQRDPIVCKARAEMGVVFQRFNLFPHRTALENVTEGPRRVKGQSKDTAVKEARALLARVGLSDKEASYPAALSGGQQQRVAIARALAMKPKLMLFDEPTSALDPELVGEVLDVMRDLANEGMTMVVVTHEVGFAREVADTVSFMEEGQLLETGNARDVLAAPENDRFREFLSRVLH
jgi:polar amino acid transport system ATP-binding protein